VESCRALPLTPIRAEDCRTALVAEIANEVLELIVSEVEIVELARRVSLFLPFLHLLCPHGAVHMDELVDLEGNQAASDRALPMQSTEQARQVLLRVVN